MLTSKLAHIWEKQIEFQKILGNEVPTDDPEMLAHHMLGLITEVGEIAQADKRWKKNKRNVYYDPNNKLEEIADAFIFLVNICLYSNVSCEDFIKAVESKVDTNISRYLKE